MFMLMLTVFTVKNFTDVRDIKATLLITLLFVLGWVIVLTLSCLPSVRRWFAYYWSISKGCSCPCRKVSVIWFTLDWNWTLLHLSWRWWLMQYLFIAYINYARVVSGTKFSWSHMKHTSCETLLIKAAIKKNRCN